MEERLNELELRYTEQQALLQELNDVVYGQQKMLDLLRSELTLLKKKLDAEPGVVDARSDERPPHY